MSGIYIPGMKIPKEPGAHSIRLFVREDGTASIWGLEEYIPHEPLEVILVPDHGRLIDADVLRQMMYHEAFETDSPMQKWDSGCWIRYKMFELMIEAVPTVIPADTDEP